MAVLQDGRNLYIQKEGIPQGSRVSSLNCNLYYAHVEKKYFSDFSDPTKDTLLLRWLDDSLYITSDLNLARLFAQTMINGIDSYGMRCGREKALVNFELNIDGTPLKQRTSQVILIV